MILGNFNIYWYQIKMKTQYLFYFFVPHKRGFQCASIVKHSETFSGHARVSRSIGIEAHGSIPPRAHWVDGMEKMQRKNLSVQEDRKIEGTKGEKKSKRCSRESEKKGKIQTKARWGGQGVKTKWYERTFQEGHPCI